MLQEAQRTSAPRACRVSISTAVWIVMWSDPAMRAPRRGWVLAYSSRMAMRPGISVSAIWISLRPQSDSLRSVTTWSWERLVLAVALISRSPRGWAVALISRPPLCWSLRARLFRADRVAGRSEPGGRGARRNAPRSGMTRISIHDPRRGPPSLDDAVGPLQQRGRDGEAEVPGPLEIDDDVAPAGGAVVQAVARQPTRSGRARWPAASRASPRWSRGRWSCTLRGDASRPG